MKQRAETGITISRDAIIVLLALLVLALGTWGAWWYTTTPPQPHWYVRWQISRFIKKQTGLSNFEYPHKFVPAPDVTAMMAKASALESNVAPKVTEANALYHDYTHLTRDIAPVLKEINPLRNRVSVLQNEVGRKSKFLDAREKELAVARANVPPSLNNLPAIALTNLSEMEQQAQPLRAIVDPVSLPLQPLRDQIAAFQAGMALKNQEILAQQREIKDINRQLGIGKRSGKTASEAIDLTTEEKTVLTNKLAELQAVVEPIKEQIAASQKELNELQANLNEKLKDIMPQLVVLRALTNRHDNLLNLETNIAALKLDVAAAQKELTEKQALIEQKQKSIADKQALADNKIKIYRDQQKEIGPLQAEVANLRKDINTKTKEAVAAQSEFGATFKKKYDESKTYTQMYGLLGQQLAVADNLLENPDIQMRRMGLAVASQAANYCMDPIENLWLASRIAEAYLLYHIDLADDQSLRGTIAPDNLFRQCGNIFRTADESDNLIRVLETAAKRSTNDKAGDYARYMLAREYENMGKLHEALAALKSIKQTNAWDRAIRRISYLEDRIKNQQR